MPVTLITGLPGHGKTLYALWLVEHRRQEENRTVYVHGVPELTLPWQELENPKEWFQVPEGSIVVLDECQRVFPTRKNGAAIPDYISEFETHRHRGLDIYLITQAPTFIDAHLRKLVDRHIHVMRPFGHRYAVVFEWQYVVSDPMRDSYHKHALKKRWKHAKEVYGWYRSSTKHTVQRRVPGKAVMLPIAAFAAVALFYVARGAFGGKAAPVVDPQRAIVDSVNMPGVGNVPPGTRELVDRLRQEPLRDYQVYVAGVVDLGRRVESWFSVEREGRAVNLSHSELEGMGYRLEYLGGCVVRVTHGVNVRYALCRGHAEPERREGADWWDGGQRDAPPRWLGAQGEGAPVLVRSR